MLWTLKTKMSFSKNKFSSFTLLLNIKLFPAAQRDFLLKDWFPHSYTGIWYTYMATHQVTCTEGTILVPGSILQSCLVSIKYFQMPEQSQSKRVPMQLMSAMHSLQCTWKWVSNILKCAHDPALGKRHIKDNVSRCLPALLFRVYNMHHWDKACVEQYLFLMYRRPFHLALWKLLLGSWILFPPHPPSFISAYLSPSLLPTFSPNYSP